MDELVRCWRCGALVEDCCCGNTSPITLTQAIDVFNDLHSRCELEEYPDLYPNEIKELDFDD